MRITKSYMFLRTKDPVRIYRQVRQDIDSAVTSAVDRLEISEEARQKNRIENEKAGKIDMRLFHLAMKSINGNQMDIMNNKSLSSDSISNNTGHDVSSDKMLRNTAEKILPDLLMPWWE